MASLDSIPNGTEVAIGSHGQTTIEEAVCPLGMDVKALCMDAIETMGPCKLDDVAEELCGLCIIDKENDFRIIEYDDVGWACIDLWIEKKIRNISEMKKGEIDPEDVLDIPEGEPLRDMPTVRMAELFAGIGAFRKAMTNLRIPCESTISEIDKYAVKSYNAVHGKTVNLGDITKIDRLPPCDLLTYGFPCQDISIAGSQKGFTEGSGTRSSLLWEVKRLIGEYAPEERPKHLIMENVKHLVAKKNLPGLQLWIDYLAGLGYVSSWAVTDPPDFGVPQNRPRVIMVSVLGGPAFEFPKPTHDRAKVKLKSSECGDFIRHVPTSPGFESKIRQLTPTECWGLMGFTPRDCYRASEVCSDAQLYKQAGNSIVVPVLEAILGKIYL